MSAADATSAPPAAPPDEHAATLVRGAVEPLRSFNRAGVLAPVDVHVATTLARLANEHGHAVLLAAALAVRAPRLQHVHVDLSTVRAAVAPEEDALVALDELDWPDVGAWPETVAASPLVAVGAHADGDTDDARPLRLVGTRLYLDRYWRYEQFVAEALRHRASSDPAVLDDEGLRAALRRVLPGEDQQGPRAAVALAATRRLAVLAGGPGTGKTTTIARLLAVLDVLAAERGAPLPRVALASPTGKASARLGEAIAGLAATLDVPEESRERLASAEPRTLHRLLGRRMNSGRFRHDRRHPLPHDVIVVDEASMVSLGLVAGLLDAVRPDARVVLVGDPDQLLSVEAGAVLGDIVGPAMRRPRSGTPDAGGAPTGGPDAASSAIAQSVAVLDTVYRFGGGIAELADAIRAGRPETVVETLRRERGDVDWLPDRDETVLRDIVEHRGHELLGAARNGDAAGALAALGRLQVLCAHRRGPYGIEHWGALQERWLAPLGFDSARTWHPGRPVIITRNDPQLGVNNGDTGVTLATDAGLVVALDALAEPVAPARLEDVETVHAMTIHKSQGSQFEHVVVVLPETDSPLLSRELLYTAVTRAQTKVTVVGSEDAVRAAVARRVQRASGLREALWDDVARS